MHLKLVRGHLLWNAPLSELLFSCLGHLEGGVVMNILMHSFGRYVYTPWTGMAICKYSSQVQSAIFCIPPIQLMILRGILRLEQNFRKIYLAVVSLMAQSGGFKLCFVSTALGICRVPLGAATEQREGRLELVVIL